MNPSHPFRPCRIALAVGAALGSLGLPAQADTYIVNTTIPGTPADGMSFREAVAAANANTGVKDTIKFAPSLRGEVIETDVQNEGQITVEDDLEVVGPGSDQLTISPVAGTDTANPFVLGFSGNGASHDVSISGITLDGRRDQVTNTGSALDFDGDNSASLTLEDVVIRDVKNDGLSTRDIHATISDSAFLDNESSGLFLKQNSATITNTRIMDNGDSGIYLKSNGDPYEIIGSTISGNQGEVRGGGIRSEAVLSHQLTIRNTSITDNTAPRGGGGIYFDVDNGGTLLLENSTISGNSTTDASMLTTDARRGSGGGLHVGRQNFLTDYTLTITQSTFSDNTAAGAGGGIFLGLRTAGSEIDIDHSTITNNSAEYSGGLLATTDSTTPNAADPGISHTVVAGNTGNVDGTDAGDSTGESGTGDDAVGDTIDATYSFFGTVGANVETDQFSTVNGGDPGLAELATPAGGNGKTEVHVPEATSPLVDAGDPALTAGQGDTPAKDQAGNARIAGDAIDIGAAEFQPEEAASDDGDDGSNDDGGSDDGSGGGTSGGGGGAVGGGLAGLLAALVALRRRRP